MNRRIVTFMMFAALACGDKAEPTTTEGASEASTGPATTQTTGEATGDGSSTGTPTTGETTGEGSSSTTMVAPPCETDAMSCGVSVDEQSSVCPDPPPAGSGLTLEPLGPGSLKITEFGYDSDCGLTISPIVKLFAPNSIIVSYDVGGQPMMGCICKYTISATLSNLPAGTWTVTVGPHSDMVEVP